MSASPVPSRAYPGVSYVWNEHSQELDKEMLRNFVDDLPYLATNVFQDHPALKPFFSQQKIQWKLIDSYIDHSYRDRQKLFVQRSRHYHEAWVDIAPSFWSYITPLFSFQPPATFTGYLSLFTLNPLLDNHSFQIGIVIDPPHAQVVTMHELIHFLFYPEMVSIWNTLLSNWQNEGRLWVLAEAINGLLLNHSPLQYLSSKTDVYHPGVSEVVDRLLPLWPFKNSWSDQSHEDFHHFLSAVLSKDARHICKPLDGHDESWGLLEMLGARH